MFLYDVIFAINVRWIFTRFSTHQTREINSTLRCILDSNAIKKNTHTHTYTKRFLHSSSRDVFFPIDNHSNSIIQNRYPRNRSNGYGYRYISFPLLNHGVEILRDYDPKFGTLFLFFFTFISKERSISSDSRFT